MKPKSLFSTACAAACLMAGPTTALAQDSGFTGRLALANWTTAIGGPAVGANVDVAGAPNSISLVGANDFSGAGCPDGTAAGFLGSCQLSFTVALGSDFRFHWDYVTTDVSPQYDAFGMLVDGARITLVANGGNTTQSGTVAVHANSSFGWYINCTDCTGGGARATLSAVSTVPEPGTSALLASGLAALGALALRQRRAAA